MLTIPTLAALALTTVSTSIPQVSMRSARLLVGDDALESVGGPAPKTLSPPPLPGGTVELRYDGSSRRLALADKKEEASGPAPAVLAVLGIPNIGSAFLLGLGGLWLSSGTEVGTVLLVAAVVRLVVAISLWIGAGVMAHERATELEAIEKEERAINEGVARPGARVESPFR